MINHLNSKYPFTLKPQPPLDQLSLFGHIPIPHHHWWLVWLTVILNIAIVGTMNGLYLLSTLRDLSTNVRIGIQFSFACFSLLWNIALRGLLETDLKESRSGVWLFLILHLLNSVLIPCVVTALSSPSCY
jgi:hypothetical protein